MKKRGKKSNDLLRQKLIYHINLVADLPPALSVGPTLSVITGATDVGLKGSAPPAAVKIT